MLPGSPAHRPTRTATPVISHRIRAAAAGLPFAIFSIVLVASASFSPESLSISTPLAGSTVSGELFVEGTIDGNAPLELTVGLAPQALGECGSMLAENRLVSTTGDFAATFVTTTVPDGTYCLVAVANAGSLSTVVADITVANTAKANESLEGLQLPTLPLPTPPFDQGEASSVPPTPTPTSVPGPLGDTSVLAPAALGAAAVVSMLVVVVGVWARRRSAA